jgi:hypothetical protein
MGRRKPGRRWKQAVAGRVLLAPVAFPVFDWHAWPHKRCVFVGLPSFSGLHNVCWPARLLQSCGGRYGGDGTQPRWIRAAADVCKVKVKYSG